MSRSFLFGGNQPSNQPKYLVEFRAGKMQMRDNKVTPETKKGLVYLNQTEDNLMHFCWKDRTSGAVEDDLIIFPDDAEFKRVSQCKTGRVFVLKFKSSSRRCFYWMQEPSEDKDEDFCKKVNEYLNNPPALGSRGASSSSSGGINMNNFADLGNLQEHDLHNLFNTVNPQQLMQMLSSVGGISSPGVLAGLLNQSGSTRTSSHSSQSTATAASSNSVSASTNSSSTSTTTAASASATAPSTTAAASQAGIQLSDLQNIITGLSVDQGKKEEVSVSLASALNSDALKTLLDNKEFMERVKEFLPSTGDSDAKDDSLPDQVSSTIQSPQFRAALRTFNSAFQLGSLGPLMQQFNLGTGCIEAANKGDLDAFIKAMEESEKEKPSNASEKDSDMALD